MVVFPSNEIGALMESTKGDLAASEKALGLIDNVIVIHVDIYDLRNYN